MAIKTLNSWTTFIGGLGNLNKRNRLKSANDFNRKTIYNLNFPKRLPQWIKYDKNILKFTGYFTGHVESVHMKIYRLRKCNIFYYLDDDKCI